VADVSREAVLEALWQWDPVGVGAFRGEAASEYDELATQIVSIVERGGSVAAVEEYARRYVAELGIEPHGIEQFVRWAQSSLHRT
jgi:hypothetical protein